MNYCGSDLWQYKQMCKLIKKFDMSMLIAHDLDVELVRSRGSVRMFELVFLFQKLMKMLPASPMRENGTSDSVILSGKCPYAKIYNGCKTEDKVDNHGRQMPLSSNCSYTGETKYNYIKLI